jgi:hypothetical protein
VFPGDVILALPIAPGSGSLQHPTTWLLDSLLWASLINLNQCVLERRDLSPGKVPNVESHADPEPALVVTQAGMSCMKFAILQPHRTPICPKSYEGLVVESSRTWREKPLRWRKNHAVDVKEAGSQSGYAAGRVSGHDDYAISGTRDNCMHKSIWRLGLAEGGNRIYLRPLRKPRAPQSCWTPISPLFRLAHRTVREPVPSRHISTSSTILVR